jgi:hypothetical protein
VVSQLASVGHYVLVAHYLCAEHGSVHHGTPELSASSDEGASPVDAATQPTRDEHHHDDCHWMSRTSDAVIETSTLRVEVVETQSAISVSVRAADAVAALAILSVAPKQSPTTTA